MKTDSRFDFHVDMTAISGHILASLWHNQMLTYDCAVNEPLIRLKRRAFVFINKGNITTLSETSAVV